MACVADFAKPETRIVVDWLWVAFLDDNCPVRCINTLSTRAIRVPNCAREALIKFEF